MSIKSLYIGINRLEVPISSNFKELKERVNSIFLINSKISSKNYNINLIEIIFLKFFIYIFKEKEENPKLYDKIQILFL